MKSTNQAEVIRIEELIPHNNADSLEIVSVGAYPVCVRKGEFHIGDLAIFIPPDNLVDTSRPHFAFLAQEGKQEVLVRAKRLRGVLSYGLLIPVPAGLSVEAGQDVAELIGMRHYEPPEEKITGGEAIRGPALVTSKYDVDSCFRYLGILPTNTPLFVTQKINGSNARYVFHKGQFYCGSRTEWKKEDERSIWWQAARRNPAIYTFCFSNPDTILYGEVYGHVGGYKYGLTNTSFIAFDILKSGLFLSPLEAREMGKEIPWVPRLDDFVLTGNREKDKEALNELAAQPSILHKETLNEGIVLEPFETLYDNKVGRIKLKVINPAYLLKK